MWADDIGLIGRDGELSRLSRLVNPPPAASHVQVLLGEPGMGKTALLAEVTRRAGASGLRALTVSGRESSRSCAYAASNRPSASAAIPAMWWARAAAERYSVASAFASALASNGRTGSCLGIADLAAAAVRADRERDARTLIDRVLGSMDAAPAPRLHQIAARARGLLADPSQAQAHFDKGLSDPAGDQWPFERAQLRLDYGEWLRRQRRINDAKPVLAAALETFRRLGAEPWTRRTEAELRACGVSATAPAAERDALAELTVQQREIVILAGRGLTNAEIADRLFLSPRTVASHLYRAYPKLGIAGRHQLRDLTAPPA